MFATQTVETVRGFEVLVEVVAGSGRAYLEHVIVSDQGGTVSEAEAAELASDAVAANYPRSRFYTVRSAEAGTFTFTCDGRGPAPGVFFAD